MFPFKSLLAIATTLTAVNALSSTLQQITGNFGFPNPTNVGFYYYKPAKLASPPPVIVAAHYCTGTAQAYFSGTTYAQLADTHGYIVIYPSSPNSGTCWDVSSNATLTHNGGSDSLGIVSMVKYAISNWGADANRVFITGTSSGAMMTNVLIGAYPDVFQAGAAFSGVAYGCFAGNGDDVWNSACAEGQLIKTPQEWGDMVRNAYPGYTGPRPSMQVWHGTADTTLYPQNYYEEVKQWTNVLGYSQTPISNISNDPLAGYNNCTYGPKFQAYLAQGVGHTVPEQEGDVLDFFGLSSLTPGGSSGSTPVSTPGSTPVSTPTQPAGSVAQHWGQCGGIGWTGPTVCASPYTCQVDNAYFSQCL